MSGCTEWWEQKRRLEEAYRWKWQRRMRITGLILTGIVGIAIALWLSLLTNLSFVVMARELARGVMR